MGPNFTPTEMARCARLPGATLPHVVSPAWALSQVPRGTCSRPRLGPAAFGVLLPQVLELWVSQPGSRSPSLTRVARGAGRGGFLWTRTLHARFCSRAPLSRRLRLRASDYSFRLGEEQQVPATRRRLPSTDTASGIARRSASPPRPRGGHAPSDHAPVTHASSLTKPRPLWALVGTTPLMATPLAAPVSGSS